MARVAVAIRPSSTANRARGEQVLDRADRAEAREHIPELTLLEPLQRQLHQPGEHVADPLQVQMGGDVQDGPAAQQRQAVLRQHQQDHAERDHVAQRCVGRQQHFVDHILAQLGRDQAEHFDAECHDEQLGQRLPPAIELADHAGQRDFAPLVGHAKFGGALELQRIAGEAAASLSVSQLAHPVRRVVDGNFSRAGAAQHHEVVQVPVQDRRGLELRQFLQGQVVSDARQLKGGGVLVERLEGSAAQ